MQFEEHSSLYSEFYLSLRKLGGAVANAMRPDPLREYCPHHVEVVRGAKFVLEVGIVVGEIIVECS